MITLSQAYRLCECDGAYLHPIEKDNDTARIHLSDKQIREHLDMKAIQVTKIRPHIDPYDGEFFGMEFDVSGITREELLKLSWKF